MAISFLFIAIIAIAIAWFFIKWIWLSKEPYINNNFTRIKDKTGKIIQLSAVKQYGNLFIGFDSNGNKIKFTKTQIINE